MAQTQSGMKTQYLLVYFTYGPVHK